MGVERIHYILWFASDTIRCLGRQKRASFAVVSDCFVVVGLYRVYRNGSWFFFSWFPTFMEEGRGFAKNELTYAVAVPFLMSMIGNISGGYLSDKLSDRYGLKTGRKLLGVSGLAVSAN